MLISAPDNLLNLLIRQNINKEDYQAENTVEKTLIQSAFNLPNTLELRLKCQFIQSVSNP